MSVLLLSSQTSYNGIDVSHHNGKINWKEVAKDKKIQYVYIKATTGATRVDERYASNVKNARENGLKVGSYHFLHHIVQPISSLIISSR